jgi:hypothetical protein
MRIDCWGGASERGPLEEREIDERTPTQADSTQGREAASDHAKGGPR